MCLVSINLQKMVTSVIKGLWTMLRTSKHDSQKIYAEDTNQ